MAKKWDPETLQRRMHLASQRYRELSQKLTDTSTQFAQQCLATRRRAAQLRATLDWYGEQSACAARLNPAPSLETADRFPAIEQVLNDLLRPIREQCRQPE